MARFPDEDTTMATTPPPTPPLMSCCTCATLLADVSRHADPATEKPPPADRTLACCARVICGPCQRQNVRFGHYCPYCQVSSLPSALPQGLREPPAYAAAAAAAMPLPPPPYTLDRPPTEASHHDQHDQHDHHAPPDDKAADGVDDEKAALLALSAAPVDDILHFVDHAHDSVASLSLRYGVPPAALRRANKLASDHLLPARRTVLIPGRLARAGAVSLSPRPAGGEAEERRKGAVRRFMVTCKVADYDVATLYLDQSAYDVGAAVEAFVADESWEREHPLADEAAAAVAAAATTTTTAAGPNAARGKAVARAWRDSRAFVRRRGGGGGPSL